MFWKQVLFWLSVVLNIFLLGRLLVSDQGYFAYQELKSEYAALEERIDNLNERNRALSHEIRLLKDDKQYIEKTIRERMNFVKDNELLYIFPEDRKGNSGAVQDEGKN